GATICLWDTDGSYYEILTTNASGYAVATVTASVPNTVNVTVTAHNYIPYENTIGTQHWLDVSRPAISFTAAALTLDITEVTATCSNSTHGSLDDTEATTHTYTIYDDSSGTATTLTGSLSWTGTDWEHLSIDVSSLPLGTYYAICTFADADVSATNSPPSATFTISPIGPPPFNLFEWLAQNWLLILMAIIILILIIVIVLLLRRRKPKEE
ncbi:MAG: hypothetical protein ACFFBR_11590, partial [Promethearchaeota archaeon]